MGVRGGRVRDARAACLGLRGHRLVNELAVAGLPAEFPAFVRAPANVERIAFLAGEPDRWKNSPDLPLRHEEPARPLP